MTHTFPFNGHTKLKDAALIYAGEGFSIIPLHWILSTGGCSCGKHKCSSPAKHPMTQYGLHDASRDPAQIETWWKKFPKANIGVCTGDVSGGLVVVDVDVAKGGTLMNFNNVPGTLEIVTGNGYHLWFRSDQDVRNSAGKLGQGLDIRGSGGYVVAPPSVHHTGRVYRFNNQDSIALFPDELLLKLSEPEPEDDDLTVSYKPVEIADFVPEGSRNVFLTKIGGKLRRGGYSPEEIESLLITTNQKRCSPPLSDREVRQIVRSLSRYTPAENLETGIEEDEEIIFEQPETEPEIIIAPDQTDGTDSTEADLFNSPSGRDPLIGAITTGQLRTTAFGKPEMILQGLFKRDWGLVIGIGSVGKSTFLFNVCICLAAGRPFPPIIPEGQIPRRVLYLDFEGSEWRSQSQIDQMCEALTDLEIKLVDDNLHWGIEPEVNNAPWRLNDKTSLLRLGEYVKKHKIDLIVIDTASQATGLKDENSNAEVQQKIVVPVRRFTKHFNVAALIVHHEGRGKEQNKVHNTQYRSRGATALPDASRYQIAMVPLDQDKRGPVEIINAKNKGFGFEKAIMTLDEDTRWFALNQLAAPSNIKIPTLEESILELLEIEDREVTLDEVCAMFPKTTKGAIKNKLGELKRLGRITRLKHGSYTVLSAP